MAQDDIEASVPGPLPRQPDLDTKLFRKLKTVEKYFSLAGFRGNYHTLSQLATYRRDIIRVDDLGLHLIWKQSPTPIQFIMPLPAAYTQSDGSPTWEWEYLTLHSRALLFSYTRLIKSQLDFSLAKEHSLLPEPFLADKGWEKWRTFFSNLFPAWHTKTLGLGSFPSSSTSLRISTTNVSSNMVNSIESRFEYGDLRLGRLNMIFWLTGYGDHYYHTRDPVLSFWQGYGKWVIIVFAYTSTMFAAMQVALSASTAPAWLTMAFKWVSYTVICLIFLQVPLIAFFYSCYGLFMLIGWVRKK